MAIDVVRQRQEFGGFHFGAAFFGWLVAVGVGVLLTALLSAAGGAVALTTNGSLGNNIKTVSLVSGILLLIALAISYYAGGYVAGRMSRFDGGRQGVGLWVIGIIAAAILALIGWGLGSSYNLLQQVNLPHIPVGQGALTFSGLVTLVIGLVVSLIAAVIGGQVGVRYHRRIDQAGFVADRPTGDEIERPAYARRSEPVFGERIERPRRR